jgi:hypothetical protein
MGRLARLVVLKGPSVIGSSRPWFMSGALSGLCFVACVEDAGPLDSSGDAMVDTGPRDAAGGGPDAAAPGPWCGRDRPLATSGLIQTGPEVDQISGDDLYRMTYRTGVVKVGCMEYAAEVRVVASVRVGVSNTSTSTDVGWNYYACNRCGDIRYFGWLSHGRESVSIGAGGVTVRQSFHPLALVASSQGATTLPCPGGNFNIIVCETGPEGPPVATTLELGADKLLSTFLSNPGGGPAFWDWRHEFEAASDFFEELGFAPPRSPPVDFKDETYFFRMFLPSFFTHPDEIEPTHELYAQCQIEGFPMKPECGYYGEEYPSRAVIHETEPFELPDLIAAPLRRWQANFREQAGP